MNPTSTGLQYKFSKARITKPPILSIVTPTYNSISYLNDAITSVEKLASLVPIEHVVADGGSDDGTVELLARSPLVRGVSQCDSGVYSAINWAIRQARAPYLLWLNSDDILYPEFVLRAVELLQAHQQIDFVLGNTHDTDFDGRIEGVRRYDPFRACDPWARLDGYFFNINSAVYRTELLRAVGKFDQMRFPIVADLHFQMRLIQREPHAVVLNEPAYMFRRHQGSLTKGKDAQQTVMRSVAGLYKAWSQDPTLHPDLRRGFEVMAVELRMGWALKCLRTGKGEGRVRALRELRRLVAEYPRELQAAVPLWVRKRLGRE